MTLWWRGFAGSLYKLEALYLYYHNANGHQTWQGHDLHWGDKLGCNNYRPISLLSNISEIYEKMMHSPLASFLNKKKILSNCQFGFRNKHSRNHAYSLTEMIRSALGNDPFKSCLISRQQFTTNNNKQSELSNVEFGVR